MGKNERQAYLKAIRSRFWRAAKKGKGIILNDFCAVCGYHRKYAIRLLNQHAKPRKKRRPGRSRSFKHYIARIPRIWNNPSHQLLRQETVNSDPL
jgi:hypothetical protein